MEAIELAQAGWHDPNLKISRQCQSLCLRAELRNCIYDLSLSITYPFWLKPNPASLRKPTKPPALCLTCRQFKAAASEMLFSDESIEVSEHDEESNSSWLCLEIKDVSRRR